MLDLLAFVHILSVCLPAVSTSELPRTTTGMGNFLVVARQTDIHMVSLDTPDFVDVVLAVNVSMKDTVAVGVDPKEGKVYWSDRGLDKVSRANLDGTEYEDIISTGRDVSDLVVDEVGRKIYWTDRSTNRIEVANLDGSMRKVLIWENLERPWAIELYQEMGYMYWTTGGEPGTLERSGMDGSERVVLISKDLRWPSGLAIDKAGSQLLWADSLNRRIEAADLNGANRRTLVSGGRPWGLTLLGPYIYWTDGESNSIRRADKTTGANAITVRASLPNLRGIQAVDRERLPSSNRCGQKNGGCSHLCLPHPNGTSCACPTGFVLWADGRTCNNETYLLFSNRVSVHRISLDTADHTVVPVPQLHRVTSLDYDSIEGKVYYTDVNINHIIRRANLDGSGMETVVGEGLTTTSGLAVDWVARNMYWTDTGRNTIEVARLDGSARKVLINDSLDEPRAIAVFPSQGYMFWTSWGNISKIERAHLDGSDRRVLVNTDLTWPEGLTLDYDMLRIFWVDSRLNRIESSDLNGNLRQILVSQLSSPIGITQHDRWIYWIDSSSIQRVDKITSESKVTVLAGVEGLKDIIVVSPQRQTGTNHCGGVHNGGCTHLCLAKSDGFTCACPDTPDSRPCSTRMGNFLVVARQTDIHMVSLDTPDFVDVVLAVNVSMEGTTAVGVDPKEGKVYWSDRGLDKVSRANLDGTEYEDIISTGLQDVWGLVVDEVGRKIYWTDWSTNRIEVANLDGSMRKVLIWENLDQPVAIELYQEMGYMYWTTRGEPGTLERSGMDGSERVVLISKDLSWPTGLAIDKAGSQLLWADNTNRRIEVADLNGANRRTLVSGVKPWGLTLLGPYIYWTDSWRRIIRRADKTTGANAITVRDNLPNRWGIQAVDRERLLSSNRCGQKNGGCSHLCLPHPNGTSCACPTGFVLWADGRTCNNETYLLFSNRVSVRGISLDTADHNVPVPELHNVTSLDYDSIEGKVYYTDVNINHTIRRANLDGSGMETVVGEGLTTTSGLAVDWVARNMYWTDTGRNTIEVARLDGSSRKVLINDSLDEPRAIAVFPSQGYMFWTGWGNISKIERAHLDGSDRRVLVNTDLTWPEGLTLDYDMLRIFWVDSRLNRIESSDLNGNLRQILVSRLSSPIGITQHDRWIYWIDSSSIQRVDKITSESKVTVLAGVEGLKDIIVVSPQRQTGTNHCGGVHNGGCTHLCLAKSDGFTCACPDTPDSRPCSTRMGNFLVVARRTDIHMVSLDTPDFVDVVLAVNVSMEGTTAVGVDPKEGKVYWSDAVLDKVSRANLDGTEYEDIISTGLQDVYGLVVDEVGRKIYWTDYGTNRIEVANLDGSMRKVLIWENLEKPQAIELYQEMGYMYWTTRGEPGTLERSGMDGSERVVLISKDLFGPRGLAIDKAGSQLLWADYYNARIEAADLNGANRRTLVSGVKPWGLTLLGPYIYWTDQTSRSIRRADKTTGANTITVRAGLPDLEGIQAVDRERLLSSNRCGQKNGGCSHLCLPHPNGTSCACPTGVLLRGDGRTCEDGPETYLLFSNRVSVHRISLDTADHTVVPVPQLHRVTSLDYDSIEGKVYYTDVNINHIIRRANLDGSGMETVVGEGLTTTSGLAVDWVARNMYWTDRGRNTIEVARLDGSSRKVLINDNLDEPRAIAVFPSQGYMFWTSWGNISKIERAHLDGSDRRVLVNTDLTWPEGLTLDYDMLRIFWVDSRLNRIESSDLNGNLRQILVSQLSSPIGITQHDRWIYWIDSSSIQRVDKITGERKVTVLAGVEGLKDIIVVSPQRQTGTNHCGMYNGSCTHLCLAKSDGFTCACPDTPDSRPCSTAHVMSGVFKGLLVVLVALVPFIIIVISWKTWQITCKGNGNSSMVHVSVNEEVPDYENEPALPGTEQEEPVYECITEEEHALPRTVDDDSSMRHVIIHREEQDYENEPALPGTEHGENVYECINEEELDRTVDDDSSMRHVIIHREEQDYENEPALPGTEHGENVYECIDEEELDRNMDDDSSMEHVAVNEEVSDYEN